MDSDAGTMRGSRIRMRPFLMPDLLLINNIIKPIQDALVGLVFPDDSLVTDVIIRRRELRGTFDLTGVSSVLVEGFDYGNEFVYVWIGDAPPQEQLI
jgi:crossover junction endodeoxyribonuclease RusA